MRAWICLEMGRSEAGGSVSALQRIVLTLMLLVHRPASGAAGVDVDGCATGDNAYAVRDQCQEEAEA